MEKLASAITDYYIRKNIIDAAKRNIYIYGFKLIISDIVNFIVIILLGLLVNCELESVVFLITLCGLRVFTGGFHAKTFFVCRLSMMITFILVMATSNLLIESGVNYIYIGLLNIISIIIVALLAPVQNPNKKLEVKQMKTNHKRSVIASLFLSVLSVILVYCKINIGVIISITTAAVAILMVVGLIVMKADEPDLFED